MALTYTPQAELGSPCPDFTLPGVDGKIYKLSDFQNAKALVVMFICNHCPYVRAVEDRIIRLAQEMTPKNVNFVAICSNDAEDYPEDSFENLRARWLEKEYGFPYLWDDRQGVAKAFGAVCTPDFFVYDDQLKLVYRGRLDDSWKDPQAVKNEELKTALQNLLQSQPVTKEQFPSMGCSIKWKEA